MLSLSTCEDTHFQKSKTIKLGDFQIDTDKIIAYGGFSKVYAGVSKDGKKVCVKAMIKSHKRKQIIKMAKQEAKILASLSDTSICELITAFQSQNHYYIVSNYYEGPTLSDYIKKKKRIPFQEVQGILRQLLKALKYLHEKKIMHRDLKPQNIIFHNNNLVLIDFGFATKLPKADHTILNEFVGTPSYMSPEILQKRKYNSKSDIWSVGIIVYEMLYGKLPWSANTEKQLHSKIRTEKLKLENDKQFPISISLKEMLMKCLTIEPQKRISWKQLFFFNENQNKSNIVYEHSEESVYSNSFCGCVLFN